MAGKGIHTYSVQESQNAGLGQAGSVYLNNAATTFTPTNGVIVAISVLEDDTAFDTLTAEDSTKYMSQAGTGYESGGNAISTNTFPQGSVLFGRWTSISLSAGKVIAYIG
jgi:hypothetical protein